MTLTLYSHLNHISWQVVWSVSNVKGQSVPRGMQEHESLITAKLLRYSGIHRMLR